MVVGRGTSDPDANSNISKVARMLWEGMGFGWARGLLQRRHLPAGGARPRACGEARLPPHHRLSLFPVHRRAGEAHLSHRRRDGRAPSGDRVPQGALSQRPSRWCSTPSPSGCAEILGGDEQHELPALQIPRAGPRLRGRGRPAPGRPSPSRPGHRHRTPTTPMTVHHHHDHDHQHDHDHDHDHGHDHDHDAWPPPPSSAAPACAASPRPRPPQPGAGGVGRHAILRPIDTLRMRAVSWRHRRPHRACEGRTSRSSS